VAVAHQETKSHLVKGPFVLCWIGSEHRGGEVLEQLLPQLLLPTRNWNGMVRISRSFRTHSLHLSMAQTGVVRLEKSAFFKLELWRMKWLLIYMHKILLCKSMYSVNLFFSNSRNNYQGLFLLFQLCRIPRSPSIRERGFPPPFSNDLGYI